MLLLPLQPTSLYVSSVFVQNRFPRKTARCASSHESGRRLFRSTNLQMIITKMRPFLETKKKHIKVLSYVRKSCLPLKIVKLERRTAVLFTYVRLLDWWKPFPVRIECWKMSVILLKCPDSGALNTQGANQKAPLLPIRRAQNRNLTRKENNFFS